MTLLRKKYCCSVWDVRR